MIKYCPKCNTDYGDTDKNFCTADGTELLVRTPMEEMMEEISLVKNKIIWNIPKGEIAYRISEKEMESLENVSGIIVDEGVTAYIFIDGELVSEIHGGTYDFIDKEELQRKLNARFGGMADRLKGVWRLITRFWMGTTLEERIEQSEDFRNAATMDELQSYISRNSVCSIVLKVDRTFPLVFEQEIHTSRYNGTVGMKLAAQITDFRQFIMTFMLGGQFGSVSNSRVKDLFQDAVAECLRGESFTGGVITEEVRQRIRFRLQEQVRQMNTGISIVRIDDCGISSEDLDRLRELDREIYLSDEELDRLHRINVIKNRLSETETQQRIEQARGELGIRRALDEVNRDNMLAEEEMEIFHETLLNLRKLREARNQEELEEAIDGIQKTKLLRQDEMEMLVFEVTERKYKRETAFTLMQLQDTVERERISQQAAQENEVSAVKHQIGLERIKNIYLDEKFQLELQQKEKEYKLNYQIQRGNIQLLDELQQIEEKKNVANHARQMEILNNLNAHDENLLKIKAGMSAEQLTAEQLARLTPEAQEAYMNAEADRARAQAEKEKTELMKELRKDDLDRIERLASHAMDTTSNIVYRERQRADEYKEDLHRTEDRLDRQQEQVMRYTVGNRKPIFTATSVNSSSVVKCPICGKENDLSDGNFCGYCKASLV